MNPVITAQDHLTATLDKLYFIQGNDAFIRGGEMDEKTVSGLNYSLYAIRQDIETAMSALESVKVETAL